MKKILSTIAIYALIVGLIVAAGPGALAQSQPWEGKVFPPGKLTIYGYGQPQFLMDYYNPWLERNRDIAPEVTIEMVQTASEADARQKVIATFASGAFNELPTVVQTAPVSMMAMAEAGLLVDLTDFLAPLEDQLVPGALDEMKYKGRIYALPESIRPQLLFYNQEIFDQYGIDPDEMDTIEGWIEVGRKLKELSGGTVYLSYIDPGANAWRYYGRRGFMPQANARIWDDEGNVVIDTDPGARLAFETIETLVNEGLVLKSAIFQPPLYEATRNGQIATFYIGAFWDEFLRGNVPDMAGKWRVRPAPMYKDIGLRGAPVSGMHVIIDKPNNPYVDLYKKLWTDFHFDAEQRQIWVEEMERQNAPYANPITKSLLADPFWKEPSAFYGGHSFREMEGLALENGAKNLRVTPDDAEADQIISVELERFIAGAQTMDEAIANMGRNLRARIGKTTPAE